MLGTDVHARCEDAHAAMALAAVGHLRPGDADPLVRSAALAVARLERMHRRGACPEADTAQAILAVARALPAGIRARLAEAGWSMGLAGDDPGSLSAARRRA